MIIVDANIHSDSHKKEMECHYKYYKNASSCIVEIGVLNGDTAKQFAANVSCPVYGIDPIIPDSMNPNLLGSEELIKQSCKNYSNYIFIKDYSYNVSKSWNKEVDYIFIDGDHTYPAVKKDFEDWIKFVKIGGHISFHDSCVYRKNIYGAGVGCHGPSIFVEELIKGHPQVEYVESVWSLSVFKKIKG